MKINIAKRFRNRTFCITFLAACLLLLQQLGLGHFLPANIMDIFNSCLTILCLLGIVVDPTTDGIGDSDLVLNNKSSAELMAENEELKKELESNK